MRIARLEIFHVVLESYVDTVTTRGHRLGTEEVVIRVETDSGIEAWGAAAPKLYMSGESVDTVTHVLRDHLGPWALDTDFGDGSSVTPKMRAVLRDNPSAKGAIDVAIHDALAKAAGEPLAIYLGADGLQPVSPFGVVFITDDDTIIADCERFLAMGTSFVKVKVPADGRDAMRRLHLVASVLGPEVGLIVDPNQAWDVATARELESDLLDTGVVEVEQPLAVDDLDGLMALQADFRIPVSLDEGVTSLEYAAALVRLGAVRALTLKLTKNGGITGTHEIASMAAGGGVSATAGATLQSGILEAATLHAYLSSPDIVRHEVKLLVKNDIVSGIEVTDRGLEVASEPGLGVTVDRDRLGEPVATL